MARRPVLQFKIVLMGSAPEIWRHIQISDLCTFWDLHIAIQSVMGWENRHLHLFTCLNPKTRLKEHFGIPDPDGMASYITIPSWTQNQKVRHYVEHNKWLRYEYDFGDDWQLQVEFEGYHDKQDKTKYPQCCAGENPAPPEDVGGIPGFYRLLEIIQDPPDEDYENMLNWVGEDYDPTQFDKSKIEFPDPEVEWHLAFRA